MFMLTTDFQGSTCQDLSMNELTPYFCYYVGSALTYTLWYCSQVEPTQQSHTESCCLIYHSCPALEINSFWL